MRSSSDFSRTTKTGHRVTSSSLVLYFLNHNELPLAPQLGLIINKSVGGSVARHRIARQLRHLVKPFITTIPPHTQLVLRVLKNEESYESDFKTLIVKALKVLNETGAQA